MSNTEIYAHTRNMREQHVAQMQLLKREPTTTVTCVPMSTMFGKKDSFTICVRTKNGSIRYYTLTVNPNTGDLSEIAHMSKNRAGFLNGLPCCGKHASLNPALSRQDVYEIITLADV